MTPRPLVGPHLAGLWANKLDILRQWQPPFVLLLQPEADKVQQLRAACPNAIIVGRMYHDDAHYAHNIHTRPIDFAREIHDEIVNNPATPLLDYVQSNNETNQNWKGIQQLNKFTERWMALADESRAYKCAILTFSVGNPDLPNKPGDPAGFDGRMLYWQQVLPSLNYAQRNGHILLLHAYGYPDMFHPAADWHIYRYERQVQAFLRMLGITGLKYAYGEIGIDRLLVGDKGGYKSVPTSDQDYVNQLLQWERDQQGQSLLLGGAIFTFGDSGGWDSYDITSTNVAAMLAAHYDDHAGDYASPDATDTTLTAAPQLPPREWDERLTQRSIELTEYQAKPGETYMRLVKGEYWEEKEHTFVETLGKDGERLPGLTLRWWWGNGNHDQEERKVTELKPNDRWMADFPMFNAGRSYGLEALGYPSDRVFGMGLGSVAQPDWNIHVSYKFVYQLATMPQTQPAPQPKPPVIAPGPTPPVKPAIPYGARIVTTVTANLREWSSLQSRIIREVPPGTVFDMVGYNEDWYQVPRGDGDGEGDGWLHHSVVKQASSGQEPPPTTPPPAGDDWVRAYPIVLEIEGGYSTDRRDKGNWTGGAVGAGELKGTKYGISAASYPHLDIANLTREQALEIYRRDYWVASGANQMPWPLSLVHFDTYVQNKNAAKRFLAESSGNVMLYLAKRLDWYTRIDDWHVWSAGWARRVAKMMTEASK